MVQELYKLYQPDPFFWEDYTDIYSTIKVLFPIDEEDIEKYGFWPEGEE